MAFKINSIKIIIQFLMNGGDLNIVNAHGETPIAFAKISTLA